MTKKTIILTASILIILFGGFTFYWFYEANQLKKFGLKLATSNNGKNSAKNISVSGFPLKHILTIEDLKIVSSNDFDLKSKAKIYKNLIPTPEGNTKNGYQLEIAILQFSTNIFDNHFTVNKISDIKVQRNNGDSYIVKFNQFPIINFVLNNNSITKLTYQDYGYQVLDSKNNEIFKISGNSNLVFELIEKNNNHHSKINFVSKNVAISDNNKFIIYEADIEYVAAPKNQSEYKAGDKLQLQSLNIKNIKITNPSYKININGNVARSEAKDKFLYDLIISFDGFESLINSITQMTQKTKPIENDPLIPTNQENKTLTQSAPSVNISVDSASPKPIDAKTDNMVSFIKYVASQNSATTDQNAIFHFKKEEGKTLLVNGFQPEMLLIQFFNNLMNKQREAAIQSKNAAQEANIKSFENR